MPPALANDLAYSSVRNERHTPTPAPSPSGPSPPMAVNIWPNIVLRKTLSNSTACARALALASRSEERRVGKECRCRLSTSRLKKKKKMKSVKGGHIDTIKVRTERV